MVDIQHLSDFVLYYCIKNQIRVNHLKLQKILYYIQAWHLVYFDKDPLFEDTPEAWVNGPVYRRVYDQFKSRGMYDDFELNEKYKDEVDELFEEVRKKIEIEQKQWDFLSSAVNHFGTMSHERLVFLTHSEKPWNEAREGLDMFEYSERTISHELMFEYYNHLRETKAKES